VPIANYNKMKIAGVATFSESAVGHSPILTIKVGGTEVLKKVYTTLPTNKTPFEVEVDANANIEAIVDVSYCRYTIEFDVQLFNGGSGGGTVVDAVLITKTITANGTYKASDDNADGYSEITVNVPTGGGDATLIEKEITENGEYDASDDGADGYSKVTVNVPEPTGEISITENGTFDVKDYASAVVSVAGSGGDAEQYKGLYDGIVTRRISGDITLDVDYVGARRSERSRTRRRHGVQRKHREEEGIGAEEDDRRQPGARAGRWGGQEHEQVGGERWGWEEKVWCIEGEDRVGPAGHMLDAGGEGTEHVIPGGSAEFSLSLPTGFFSLSD
jgi:hypothetical protein